MGRSPALPASLSPEAPHALGPALPVSSPSSQVALALAPPPIPQRPGEQEASARQGHALPLTSCLGLSLECLMGAPGCGLIWCYHFLLHIVGPLVQKTQVSNCCGLWVVCEEGLSG